MPNTPVPAACEAMPVEGQTSRRLFLAAGSAATVFATVRAAAGRPLDGADDRALALWEARHELRQPILAAYKAQWEAQARMPWWAVPGHESVAGDGSPCGGDVGWPAIQGLTPSERGYNTIIRPGVPWCRKTFDINVSMFGKEKALPVYRRQLRELAKRRKAQKEEERLSGYTAATEALDALYERLDPINDAVDALSLATPNAAAAVIIRRAIYEAGPADIVSHELDVAAIALRHLRPVLRGIIAAHVDDLLDNPKARLGSRAAYIGDYQHGCIPLQASPYETAPEA